MRTTIVICIVLSACFPVGPSIESSPLSHSPRGAEGWIQVRKAPRTDIELLMLTDSSYVVQTTDGRIAEARFSDVSNIKLKAAGFLQGGAPKPEQYQFIRLRARFPYGISDDVRAKLLQKAGQTEIVQLRPQS